MKLNYAFLIMLCLGLFLASCGDDEEEPATCETADLTYTNDIASIINGSCAVSGCHNAGATATFAMSDFAETSAAVGFGRIVGAINHSDGFLPMPYPSGSDKIAQCDIDKITQWIADGAPE